MKSINSDNQGKEVLFSNKYNIFYLSFFVIFYLFNKLRTNKKIIKVIKIDKKTYKIRRKVI